MNGVKAMAKKTNKPGFMMYHEELRRVMKYADKETFWKMIEAMLDYSEFGIEPSFVGAEAYMFDTLRAGLERDNDKYNECVEAKRAAGIKSGEARRKKRDAQASPCDEHENEAEPQKVETMQETECDGLPWQDVPPPMQPLEVVQGNPDAVGERGCEKFPPTLEMVAQYVKARGLQVDVQQFLSVNEASGWKDSNGKPIRNWRMWLEGWAMLYPLKGKQSAASGKVPNFLAYPQRTYQEGELDHIFTDLTPYLEKSGAEA